MQEGKGHSVTIEGRERAFITGVEDVDCFNEEIAVIASAMGAITITGSGLKVSRLDLEAGNVAIEGKIDSLEYGAARKNGFFSRVLR